MASRGALDDSAGWQHFGERLNPGMERIRVARGHPHRRVHQSIGVGHSIVGKVLFGYARHARLIELPETTSLSVR